MLCRHLRAGKVTHRICDIQQAFLLELVHRNCCKESAHMPNCEAQNSHGFTSRSSAKPRKHES